MKKKTQQNKASSSKPYIYIIFREKEQFKLKPDWKDLQAIV